MTTYRTICRYYLVASCGTDGLGRRLNSDIDTAVTTPGWGDEIAAGILEEQLMNWEVLPGETVEEFVAALGVMART